MGHLLPRTVYASGGGVVVSYHPHRYAAPPFVMAALYRVTSKLGARVMERKSLDSAEVASLPRGALFHGVLRDAWIRRVGGGYVVARSVEEVE